MADINQVITWGIGTPAGIPEFLTLGLQIGEEAVTYLLDVAIVDALTYGVSLSDALVSGVSIADALTYGVSIADTART